MRYLTALILLPFAFLLSACLGAETGEETPTLTTIGVSQEVQVACASAAAQSVASIDENTDFDALMAELKDRGQACLIAAARDVVTAQIIKAVPAIAGEVVASPGDPAAAAAIAG